MPPRKRVKRNGEDSPPTNTPVRSTRRVPDTQRTPATHRNTRAQSVRSTRSDATSTPLPTGRAPSPYRTRHRRSVRGPELAELEGSRDDCVPPSDDEEYDAWRAVRAIERAEQLQLEDDESEAGPSQPSPRPSLSPANSPISRRSASPHASLPPVPAPPAFEAFFDDYASSSSLDDGIEVDDYVPSRKGKEVIRGGCVLSRSPSPAPLDVVVSLASQPAVIPLSVRSPPQHTSPLLSVANSKARNSSSLPPPSPSLSPERQSPIAARLSSPAHKPPDPPDGGGGGDADVFAGFEPDLGMDLDDDYFDESLPPLRHTTREPVQEPDQEPDREPDLDVDRESPDPLRVSPGPPSRLHSAAIPRHSPSPSPRAQPPRIPSSPPDPLDLIGAESPSPPPVPLPPPRSHPSLPHPPSPPSSRTRPLAPTPPRSPQSPNVPPLTDNGVHNRPQSRSSSPLTDPPSSPPPSSFRRHLMMPPPAAADPALLQFRSARSFRTRTALQLQPYTRERQQYQSALRQGGLTKGRRAVAPAAEVTANKDTDTSESGDVSSAADEDATPPEAIVIGATQEAPREPRHRPPKELVDADFDEYFVRFGEVAVEEDDEAAKRLQVIARERLKKAKEMRRQLRAEDKVRRQFEALMAGEQAQAVREKREKDKEERRQRKERERVEKEKRDQERQARRELEAESKREREAKRDEARTRQLERNKTAGRTIRTPTSNGGKTPRTKTYGGKNRRPLLDMSGDSELSDAPPEVETRRPTHARLPSPSTTPLSPVLAPRRRRSPSARDQTPPLPEYEAPAYDDFGGGIFDDFGGDDGGPDDYGTPLPPRRRDSRGPVSTQRRRLPSSSSGDDSDADADSESHDSSAPAPADRREKIARRMLPGVMLKRLAAAEKDRQARKAAAQRQRSGRDRDTPSPVRPGHAVVRRGSGHGLEDMVDLFASDNSDNDNGPLALEAEEGDTDASDGAIVISSDSEGFEAREDNRHDGLANLQRGDFEALVRGRDADGRHRSDRERGRDNGNDRGDGQRSHKRRTPRPALGLKKRVRAPPLSPRGMVQARLDFPVVDKPESRSSKRTSKSKNRSDRVRHDAPRGRTKTHRPAIRLDDSVIFATDDFAFESDNDEITVIKEVQPPHAKRTFARVSSKNDPRARAQAARSSASPARSSPRNSSPARDPRRALDEGIGKARSWANFDRFPVDFDITPLPSGVYCAATTVVGSGRLATMLDVLAGGPVEPKPVHAHGVDLHPDMGLEETLAVLPIVLDGASASLRSFIDNPSRQPELAGKVFAPLAFLRDLFASSPESHSAFTHLVEFGAKLDGIALTGSKEDRATIEQLMLVRYTLLEMAVFASPMDVPRSATALVRLLLVYGFDRTLRPLKRILRVQADTPEITDESVALWVALGYILAAHDKQYASASAGAADDTFAQVIVDALSQRFPNEVGPLAAERVWFLLFGLCALSQFGPDGVVVAEYTPHPRWGLVRRAVSLIKVTHSQEAEEAAHSDQLQGRDRYIKTVVARCLRLSSTWTWSFDRGSFSVATRDLGMIFKDRQHRNLPTEPPADFPAFISQFDLSLTASEETKRASAFELYLRLAAVAASDLIGSAEELSAAHQAERDVQRLIMSIFPLSAVTFTRASPPTPRQLGALVNRYSTMVVACYFSPALLPWLLANSLKWLAFDKAGFESRQVVIRGLMYLAVACRHHSHPLDAVVGRLADILATLQTELESVGRPTNPTHFPTRVEIERTMVLVVTAFRQIILHTGYAPRPQPVYPDPALLHECWTARVFDLDLAKDVKSGLEIVSTIQAFLDARSAALPTRARQARNTALESLDDYPSLGFDFDAVDLAALGGDTEARPVDPMEVADAKFAQIILNVICPKIYRLLSDMLPPVLDSVTDGDERTDRQVLINKLTKCWSDCAAIVVVEHHLQEWSTYVGPFGQQSWSRLGNDAGRVQVGLHFMLNVALLDPGAFRTHEEEFIALLFQTLVTDRLTIEHKYAFAVFGLPFALDHALFAGVRELLPPDGAEFDRAGFMDKRPEILAAIFGNIDPLLGSRFTPADMKTLIYRCVNLLVGAMVGYESAIDARRVIHRESYRVFVRETVRELRRVAGDYVSPVGVPALKALEWK